MDNWQERFLNVTWNEFVNLSYALSQKIANRKQYFDLIIAIARGGLTLSQLLSDTLNLPIASFTVQSYKDLKQTNLPHIVYGLDAKLTGKKILLVDDVSDTGKTFIRGISYLEELGAQKKNITTVSLHLKPHATFQPDFYVQKTAAWIIYPYEAHETMKQLSIMWRKEGITTEEIKNRFISLQFPVQNIKN